MPPKSLVPVVIILLIAGLSPLSPVGISSIHKANAATRTVSLVGYYSTGWNNTPANPTITITQGDTLVITTSSGDTFMHHFFVDINGGGMVPDCTVDKCASIIPPTKTDTLTGFTAGTYTYYCQYHVAMKGTFIVQPPPPDFSITANPSSLSIMQGTSQTSTLTVSSLNGFSGTVTFSAPSTQAGITATLAGSSVTVTPSSPGTTTLTVTVASSTAKGSYTVSVTGSGGGNTHTASVPVAVVGPDFAISLDQSSLSIVVGSSGNATLTVTSQNGFSGNVNLTATVSPAGPTVSLNPVKVALTSGGSATSKLSITTSSGAYSTSTGSYTVTVTVTGNPSLSHIVTLPVTVTSSPTPAAGIPALPVVLGALVILIVILVIVYVVLKRKPGKALGKR